MRVSQHLRSNVIGYIALFFAISGTAAALDGENTVFTDDIVNGEVRTGDIRNNSVNANKLADGSVAGAEIADGSVAGAEIADGSVAGAEIADGAVSSNKVQDGAINSAKVLDDSLGAGDLATNAVAQAEIATNGVAATEIQNDAIDSGEIVDFGLTNQDVGVLFAEVSAAGTLDNSSGGVTVTKLASPAGNYEVAFGRAVNICTAVATIGPAGAGSATGEVNVADRSGNTQAVFVDTNTSAGAAGDRAFRLVVVC